MKNSKLFAIDLDGTLLDSSSSCPSEFEAVIEDANNRGDYILIASGRIESNIRALLGNFVRPNCLFLSQNGAFISDALGTTIFEKVLSAEQIAYVLSIRRYLSRSSYLLAYGKSRVYVDKCNKSLEKQLQQYNIEYALIKDYLSIKEPIGKFAVFNLESRPEDNQDLFLSSLSLVAMKSHEKILDITTSAATKENGVSFVINMLNIPFSRVYAFGDSENDIGMLKCAKYSYAMSNADEKVKRVAKSIAPSNDEKGVITVLKSLLA